MSFFTKFAQGSAAQLGGREKFVLPYRNRLRLEIDTVGIGMTEDIENFPVRVRLGSSIGKNSFDASGVFEFLDELTTISPDSTANIDYARKIKITDVDFNNLYVEIEEWDQVGRSAELWVKVPKVGYNKKTYLYLYYDYNAEDNERIGVVGSTAAQNVWDSNFEFVYHMNQDPSGGSGTILDSTQNGRNGTPANMVSGDLVGGPYGLNSIDFNGTDANIQVPFLGVSNQYYTTEVLFLRDNIQNNNSSVLLSAGSGGDLNGIMLSTDLYSGNNGQLFGSNGIANDDYLWYDGSQYDRLAGGGNPLIIADDVWAYVNLKYQINNVDGSEHFIGSNDNNTNFIDGQIAEIRVSSTKRSDSWSRATQKTLEDNMINYSQTDTKWVWDSPLNYRYRITIDHTKIDSPLTDFPVAIQIGTSVGRNGRDVTQVFDRLGSSQYKISFLDENNNELYGDIELWDSVNEVAVIHVKVPTVHSDKDTTIYMYYDPSTADNTTYLGVSGGAVAQNVWDSDFYGVYHLDELPGGGSDQFKDATSYNHDLTNYNMSTSASVFAKPGKGLAFDGVNDVALDLATIPANVITVEVGGIGNTSGIKCVGGISQSTSSQRFGVHLNNGYVTFNHNGTLVYSGTEQVTSGQFFHGVISQSSTSSRSLYTNGGDRVNDTSTRNWFSSSSNLWISAGGWNTSTFFPYAGTISELRFSRIARPEEWIKATYHTLNDSLLSWSKEESPFNWLDGFRYRKEFIIDHKKIGETLTDFPVTIHLNNSAGQASEDVTDIFNVLTESYPDWNGDSFEGKDGEAPNSEIWDVTDPGGYLIIQNNELNFSPNQTGITQAEMISTFSIRGDFDIRISYTVNSGSNPPSGVSYFPAFYVRNDRVSPTEAAYVSSGRNSGGLLFTSSGTDVAYDDYNHSVTSGKLRMTRINGEVKCFVWNGVQWEWDGNTNGRVLINSIDDDMYVRLYYEEENGSTVDTDNDNFEVVQGTVIFPSSTKLDVNKKKIAVTTDDGKTQCYVEIENFNVTNEQSTLHTKIPSISASQDTKIYLYFDSIADDNITYVGDTGDVVAQNVWDSNFEAVYHMNQDPSGGSGSLKDSTVNGYDGTPIGMASNDLVEDDVGASAIDFNGTDDTIQLSNGFDSTSDFTFECKVYKKSTTSDFGRIFANGANATEGWSIWIRSSTGYWAGADEANDNFWARSGNYNHSIWTVLGCVKDGLNSGGNIYVNGNEDTQGTNTDAILSTSESISYLGSLADTERYAGMILAEVRISSIKRSAPWIKATSHSLRNRIFRYIGYTKTR